MDTMDILLWVVVFGVVFAVAWYAMKKMKKGGNDVMGGEQPETPAAEEPMAEESNEEQPSAM